MPSDRMFHLMNRAHRVVLRATGGRLGWSMPLYRMPVVELTTTGRKSGLQRTTMLTSPYQDGEQVVLVASAGGNDQHPAWFLNIESNPNVSVAMGGRPARPMRAEIADARQRAELWPRIVADHSNYAGYQRKTDREIPLVVLHPIDA